MQNQFYIVLNIAELPANPDYWKNCTTKISADLQKLGINAEISLGSLVVKKKFFVGTRMLDFNKPDELKKYNEAEAKIENVLDKYIHQQ